MNPTKTRYSINLVIEETNAHCTVSDFVIVSLESDCILIFVAAVIDVYLHVHLPQFLIKVKAQKSIHINTLVNTNTENQILYKSHVSDISYDKRS